MAMTEDAPLGPDEQMSGAIFKANVDLFDNQEGDSIIQPSNQNSQIKKRGKKVHNYVPPPTKSIEICRN